jgi:thymidylate kinase
MLEKLLNVLFSHFELSQIKYVILRNYELLPKQLKPGSDIDILIDEDSYCNIKDILKTIPGLEIVVFVNRSYVKEFFCIYNKKIGIKLDFHANEEWKGATYLTGKEILNNKVAYQNFYIPSPIHEAIISLFSSLLHGGFIKKKYTLKVKETFSKQEHLLKQILGKKIGSSNLEALISYAKGEIEEKSVINIRKNILIRIAIYNVKINPTTYIKKIIKHISHEVKILVKPKGLMVGFVGVDGSGKSTLIDQTYATILKITQPDRISIYHLFPGTNRQETTSTQPHLKKPYPLLKGITKELYLLFRFWTGYLASIRELSKTSLIIMDRSNIDVVIDPARFRLKRLLLRPLFIELMPKPDLIFYCFGDSQIIFNRKRELSIYEIQRQQDKLHKIAKQYSNWQSIDTTKLTTDECLKLITRSIISFISEREK